MAIHRGPKDTDAAWRKREIPEGVLDSDALRINLEETAVEQVAVDPKYNVLQEVVAGYRGIQKTVEARGPPTDTGSNKKTPGCGSPGTMGAPPSLGSRGPKFLRGSRTSV
jgi:hypothetical protein